MSMLLNGQVIRRGHIHASDVADFKANPLTADELSAAALTLFKEMIRRAAVNSDSKAELATAINSMFIELGW